MPLLEVRGLVKNYGRRRVVNGVSFEVDAGEVVGLLGPNGAGKTTSFRMTTGMVTPYAGNVVFEGQDVTHWPMYRRARLGMGYLSQESSIFRKLTVEQNVLAILEAVPMVRSLGRRPTRKERQAITDEVLAQFGLDRVRRSIAATLSGGEKRRLEIARCLVTEPKLILLDEPFTGIDPKTISDIQGIVRQLRNRRIGLLITDHNVRETLKITDRSYVITDGVVEAHGTPQEIISHPVVIAKYLGQDFARDALDGFRTDAAHAFTAGPHRPAAGRASSTPDRPAPSGAVQHLLAQERIYALIERLKGRDSEAAQTELAALGGAAIPALIEALERRDLEIRCLAFKVLQRITGGQVRFDAYAPEAARRQEIEMLRQQLLRKAG